MRFRVAKRIVRDALRGRNANPARTQRAIRTWALRRNRHVFRTIRSWLGPETPSPHAVWVPHEATGKDIDLIGKHFNVNRGSKGERFRNAL